jgi:hypothetical protein
LSVLSDLFGDRSYADLSDEEVRLYQREWKRRNRDKSKAKYAERRDALNARRRELNGRPGRAEANRQYQAEWKTKNKHRFAAYYRRYRLKSEYGITPELYEIMLAAQNKSCAICGSPSSGRWHSTLVIDHDHVSGRVRGLLCHHCNTLLGHAKDNPALLRSAAEYVEHGRRSE